MVEPAWRQQIQRVWDGKLVDGASPDSLDNRADSPGADGIPQDGSEGAFSPGGVQRQVRLGVLAVLFALVIVLASAADASDVTTDPDSEAGFVSEINLFRQEIGLEPMEVDESLTLAARDWAREMAAVGEISHAPDLGVGIETGWLKLGENVGVGPDVTALHEAFLASPTHRANLTDPTFNKIAVGVIRDGDTLYTTHRFMHRSDSSESPDLLARLAAERRAAAAIPASPTVTVALPVSGALTLAPAGAKIAESPR